MATDACSRHVVGSRSIQNVGKIGGSESPSFGTRGSQVQILPLRPNFPYSLRLFRSANKPPDASGTVIGTEIARAGLRLLAKCLGNLGSVVEGIAGQRQLSFARSLCRSEDELGAESLP